jgi:hypothetical protein
MEPGNDYTFPGNYVTEFPMKNMGSKRFGQVGMQQKMLDKYAPLEDPYAYNRTRNTTDNTYSVPFTPLPKPLPVPNVKAPANSTNSRYQPSTTDNTYVAPPTALPKPTPAELLRQFQIAEEEEAKEKEITKMQTSFNNYETNKPTPTTKSAPQKVLGYPQTKDASRQFFSLLPNFIPGVNDVLDYRDVIEGMYTGNRTQMNQGILGITAPGFAGKGMGEILDYVTENTLGRKVADDNQKRREDLVNMSTSDLQKIYTKYGPGGYDKWKADGSPQLQMGGTIGVPRVNGQVVSSQPQSLTSVRRTRGPIQKNNKGDVKTMPKKAVKNILKNIR